MSLKQPTDFEVTLARATQSIEGIPSNGGSWVDAMVIRVAQAIKMFTQKNLDENGFVWTLETIRNTKHEYSTYEESIKKEKVVEIINLLINKLKGA